MIKIKVTDKRLEIKGHAGYAGKGEDIVCAAVSILAYTFIELNDVDVIEYTVDSIVVEYSDNTDISFIKAGFKLIEKDYPDNVRIV